MRSFTAMFLVGIVCFWPENKCFSKPMPAQTSKTICMRGSVISVNVISDAPESRYASNFLEIQLMVELVNTSQTPIIFLNREPMFVGAALAKEPDDFGTGNYLARTYIGSAVSLAPEWTTLRRGLDKPTPPPNQTRILMPNQSWSLRATVGVSLAEHSEMFAPAKSTSLADMKKLSTVWLRVVCEVWPWNLESSVDRGKLSYGHRLQRRWRNVGFLWLDDIYSEPISLNLDATTR